MARVKDGLKTFQGRGGNLLENLFIVILVFYPLRHIALGLDLWDTGYSYGNFQYMGTQQMGGMWFFATYLTNVTGSFLMKLPNADTLMGMNLYTGLFVSAMALIGYFFCTRKLKMQKGIAFAGEMTALSLCWCPTATFYNYLTYFFFLAASVFLYLGLTKEKKGYLICAGACLGANVLVRFPNLSEAAMIVAVWAYDLIVWAEEIPVKVGRSRKGLAHFLTERMGKTTGKLTRETAKTTEVSGERNGASERKAGASEGETVLSEGKTDASEGKADASETNLNVTRDKRGMLSGLQAKGADRPETFWGRIIRHTLWCLLGYAAALGVLLLWIHLRYGITEYAEGISRLFAMTENASGYKLTSMVNGVVGAYVEHLYWAVRMALMVLGGMVMFAAAGGLEKLLSQKGKAGNCRPALYLHIGVRALWALICAAMVAWLYKRGFFSLLFYSYDPIVHPGILFLMLTMFMAVVRIFHRNSPKEEKLISGMLILIILLTPLGSNNGVMPSLNNLFLAAPYTLWESWRFLRCVGNGKIAVGRKQAGGVTLSSFPAKAFMTAFLALCLFVFGAFGWRFAFAEATGIQDAVAEVDNIPVLKNIKMSLQKAEWMTELGAYMGENGLQGQEVILYGYIPALSYYLQMPAAITTWSDLASYRYEVMKEDVARLEEAIAAGEKDKPVIILENTYALYAEGGRGAMEAAGLPEAAGQNVETDPKWRLWLEFMDTFGYEQTFRNGKFAVYR